MVKLTSAKHRLPLQTPAAWIPEKIMHNENQPSRKFPKLLYIPCFPFTDVIHNLMIMLLLSRLYFDFTDLTGKTHMKGTSLIRTVAGEMNSTKPGPPVRRQLPSGFQSTQKKNNTSGRYHPIPSNPHVVTIKNEKAEMQSSYTHSFNRFVTLYLYMYFAFNSILFILTPAPKSSH